MHFPTSSNCPRGAEWPDPLVMFDGTPVRTAADWTDRRKPELKRLFQHYMYGDFRRRRRMSGQEISRDEQCLGGKAVRREIALSVGPADCPKIMLLVITPKLLPAGGVPVFVALNFTGNHTVMNDPGIALPAGWMPKGPGVENNRATDAGRGTGAGLWAIEDIVGRGYGLATFYYGDVMPDKPDYSEGIYRCFRQSTGAQRKPTEWGAIAAWAWGLQRAVDYLVTDKASMPSGSWPSAIRATARRHSWPRPSTTGLPPSFRTRPVAAAARPAGGRTQRGSQSPGSTKFSLTGSTRSFTVSAGRKNTCRSISTAWWRLRAAGRAADQRRAGPVGRSGRAVRGARGRGAGLSAAGPRGIAAGHHAAGRRSADRGRAELLHPQCPAPGRPAILGYVSRLCRSRAESAVASGQRIAEPSESGLGEGTVPILRSKMGLSPTVLGSALTPLGHGVAAEHRRLLMLFAIFPRRRGTPIGPDAAFGFAGFGLQLGQRPILLEVFVVPGQPGADHLEAEIQPVLFVQRAEDVFVFVALAPDHPDFFLQAELFEVMFGRLGIGLTRLGRVDVEQPHDAPAAVVLDADRVAAEHFDDRAAEFLFPGLGRGRQQDKTQRARASLRARTRAFIGAFLSQP